MSRNKKHLDRRVGFENIKSKHVDRQRIILSIVETDSTFKFTPETVNTGTVWVGKCIHCNSKLAVASDGSTYAGVTVEHINPRCNNGDETDPRNLALACSSCNNEKGVRHDKFVGKRRKKSTRADEVIEALKEKRAIRWREPPDALLVKS